jgi:8-oxo-dGTP pyrophosphatase MutT (NUDIX family)
VTAPYQVRAAGGVVWRTGDDGAPEVLLVHRPKYDDWTIPKGKAERGESDEACALREVEEETGLRCELGAYAGDIEYVDREGRRKIVRYWEMRPVEGVFTPHREVDAVRWMSVAEAVGVLSYERDVPVLEAFAARYEG